MVCIRHTENYTRLSCFWETARCRVKSCQILQNCTTALIKTRQLQTLHFAPDAPFAAIVYEDKVKQGLFLFWHFINLYILIHLHTYLQPGPSTDMTLKQVGILSVYVGNFHYLLRHGAHVVLTMSCAVWLTMWKHNIIHKNQKHITFHCHQRTTEPQSQVSCTENFVKFRRVVFDAREWPDRQTYRHAHHNARPIQEQSNYRLTKLWAFDWYQNVSLAVPVETCPS